MTALSSTCRQLAFAIALIGLAIITPQTRAALNAQEQEVANLLTSDPGQKRGSMREDAILSSVARSRAQDLANRNYFSHTNPDGYGPNALVTQAGYGLPTWWGSSNTDNSIESIAGGQGSAATVWTAWMNSPSHRTHLLAEVSFYQNQTCYGIGYAYNAASTYKHYWVVITAPPSTLPPPLDVVQGPCLADFNRDGSADILWRNRYSNERSIWWMNRNVAVGAGALSAAPAGWTLGGTGDFNKDGNVDLLWQDLASGNRYIWLMNGTTVSSTITLANVPGVWVIVATGDMDANGSVDILWRHRHTGELTVWLMNGMSAIGSTTIGVISNYWSTAAVADFNSDGKTDILWQNSTSGEYSIWLMSGTTPTGVVSLGYVSTGWSIGGAADFDHDGKPDILWENKISGQCAFWFMNGTSPKSASGLGFVDISWSMRN